MNEVRAVVVDKSRVEREREQKLIELGRREIRARMHARREEARKRAIIDVVNRHINASAGELKERLEQVERDSRIYTAGDEEDLFNQVLDAMRISY